MEGDIEPQPSSEWQADARVVSSSCRSSWELISILQWQSFNRFAYGLRLVSWHNWFYESKEPRGKRMKDNTFATPFLFYWPHPTRLTPTTKVSGVHYNHPISALPCICNWPITVRRGYLYAVEKLLILHSWLIGAGGIAYGNWWVYSNATWELTVVPTQLALLTFP